MNLETIWSPTEKALYDRLVDDPFSSHWCISDLLAHYQLDGQPVESDAMGGTVEIIDKVLNYINQQLSRNNNGIVPKQLLRRGCFPRIRQMRDVHQFDVGSHLACCHALAVRNAPVHLCRTLGHNRLADRLYRTCARVPVTTLGLTALFHDMFKCLRPRRPLPSKMGVLADFEWQLPDGTYPTSQVREDEGAIASSAMPYFVADDSVTDPAIRAILIGNRMGQLLYSRIKEHPQDHPESFKHRINQLLTEPWAWLGIYMGIVDWQGKGLAQYVVATRKKAVRSLHDAGVELLSVIEEHLLCMEQTLGTGAGIGPVEGHASGCTVCDHGGI
ncbi:MAG: hypothetical protein HQL07_12315 [Nitrospirae bacterium]|nr:hypothetical protein [Magnetococcales bacterium]HAT51188.1 hypothetical protein [Alphaproteobacteria bacterium]